MTFYVNCPCCSALLEVNAEDGRVVNKWTASERNKSGEDKMKSALQKLQDDKKKRETLLENTKSNLDAKKKRMDEAFRKEVEKIKKEGLGEKPLTPFDLD
jgi:uncharacterized Zn finger protein (UPF0148 family)